MKRIFYSIIALTLLAGCSREDVLPESPKEGLVQLESVGVGSMTRGSIIDDNFAFENGDKVVMTAMVNGSTISNTFTYDGSKWTQDSPEDNNYTLICIQDNPEIESVVSYGGNATPPSDGGVNQNSRESYIAADELKADHSKEEIQFTNGIVSAQLAHAGCDFVLKVCDGPGSGNKLDEGTPTLVFWMNLDGGKSQEFTAWNAEKRQHSDGLWYTTFRVILPAGSTIEKAILRDTNSVTENTATEISFYRADDWTSSEEIALQPGIRYTATYEFNEYVTVTEVGMEIMPFSENPEQEITASKDWSFDETTNTYIVFSAEGLQIVNKAIANNMTNKAAYNITLAADIVLHDPANGDGNNWIPLGHCDSNGHEYAYEGTFNGAGHTISNLQVNRTDLVYPALVGYAGEGCKIENLTLASPTIIGDDYAGGIIAYTWDKNVSITNCHIIGGSIKGGTVGGVAGEYEGDIVACTVNGTTLEGYTAGGITGMQYIGRIIACGVNGVNFILSSSNARLGGIAEYVSVIYDDTYTRIYSCYVNDCTKGTDSQAIEGNANLIGRISVKESNTAEMYNCAYRTKGSSITYGVGGTKTGPTENDYTVDMFITQRDMTSTDWSIVASNLNEGIRNWNEYNPTLPCNWEWDATEEGKLKVKQ